MNEIMLNGTLVLYNDIYYIDVDGNDTEGDGSFDNPFATFDKAMEFANDGDLIYFKKGIYHITELKANNADSGLSAFLYDKNKEITIYAEQFSLFVMDNTKNSVRDTHAIAIANTSTQIIGFVINWNITNKSPNYARSIFGRVDGRANGSIYNSHFIIKSKTSFSYANTVNSLKCINCQFDILEELEKSYSGKTTFEKCTFSGLSSLDTVAGMQGDDNKFNVLYDATYKSTPYYKDYGIYGGLYKWSNNKFLIKQNNQYYTIKPEYYSNGQFQNLILEGEEQPNENDYENFGFDDVNDLLTFQDTKTIEGVDKGSLGEGKYFEIELDDEVENILEVK